MNHNELYEHRRNFYLSLGSTARGGIILLALLGLGSFAGGMLAGEYTRTWGSFLFNLLFFFCLALGGVAFGGMQDAVGAVVHGLSGIARIEHAFDDQLVGPDLAHRVEVVPADRVGTQAGTAHGARRHL